MTRRSQPSGRPVARPPVLARKGPRRPHHALTAAALVAAATALGCGDAEDALGPATAGATTSTSADETAIGAEPTAMPVARPAAGPAPGAPPSTPWFELAGAGLDFVHDSGERGEHRIAASLCGGGALFDADGDGDLDVYLVQSGDHDDPAARGPNRLYLNDGAGRFTCHTEASGTGDRGYGFGVAVGDVDGDGDLDLYVTNDGPNVLYRNEGDGTFTDVTARAGVGDPRMSTGAKFVDVDGDGDLDLWVLNYIDWRPELTARQCYNELGTRDYCVPTAYEAPARDTLYRNEGDGTFTDVSEAAGIAGAPGTGLGLVAGDFDGDGRVDMFVANDAMKDRLWINLGDGRFEDRALIAGVATDARGHMTASMGVIARDVDFDGDLDLMVCNVAQESDSLFRNDGGFFVEVSNVAGIASVSRPFTRFGQAWHDFDHDGLLDLYQANGRVMRQERTFDEADPYAEPNLVFRGTARGRFEEVRPRGGTAEPLHATSRAAAFGDVDGDGDVDVLVVNRDGPAHLLRNVAPKRGGAVTIELREPDGRLAHGARLTARVGDRIVRIDPDPSYSYLASNDPRAHVGLGEAPAAELVEVRWADGSREAFPDVPAGARVVLVRGTGEPAG